MALHVFAATSGNFWEAPRAAIAVKKNVPLEWMELSQLSLYMALTTGPLNAWIWLADERSLFRETHGKRSSRQLSTIPYHFAKWFQLFLIRSYNSNTTKANKTKHINIVNNEIKTTDNFHVFPQNYVVLCM